MVDRVDRITRGDDTDNPFVQINSVCDTDDKFLIKLVLIFDLFTNNTGIYYSVSSLFLVLVEIKCWKFPVRNLGPFVYANMSDVSQRTTIVM